jgi:hypothetical protein
MTNDSGSVDRRTVLQAIGVAGAFGVAGCTGNGADGNGSTDSDPATQTSATGGTESPEVEPTAGISVDTSEGDRTVTLVSLGNGADGVEIGGCAEPKTITSVGESATADCGGDGRLVVRAFDQEEGVENVVRKIPPVTSNPEDDCSETPEGEPTAGITVDEDETPTVTVVSMGQSTSRVEVRGCGEQKRVEMVGASAEVKACQPGDTIEVYVIGCDGQSVLIRSFSVPEDA